MEDADETNVTDGREIRRVIAANRETFRCRKTVRFRQRRSSSIAFMIFSVFSCISSWKTSMAFLFSS